MIFYIFLKFAFFIGCFQYSESWDCDERKTHPEIKLKNKLFCDYDRDERPESKNGTIVKVHLYIKGFEYDETSDKLTIHSWLRMKWTDDRLKWDAKEHENIEAVVVEESDLWMPPLAHYNSPETQYTENCASAPCHLSNSGKVACVPPCSHSSQCKSDYSNWPYDIQNCTFHFGTWMHKGEEIKFEEQKTSIDKEDLTHNEWKIIKIKSRNNIGNYTCCPNDTYPSIHYNIVIERYSSTARVFIYSPAAILAVLNLTTLWLSPSCTERIVMIVVSLLSHFSFIQQLSWLVPKNGEVIPVAFIYFRDSLIFAAVLLIETMIMRGLLYCRTATPTWMKSFTQTIRGHKVGQFMFENPYVINNENKPTFINDTTVDDSANLVEGGTADDTPTTDTTKANERDVWFSAVKIIDTLLFIILFICYIVMLVGWLPSSRNDYLDEKTVDIENGTAT